MNGSGRPLPEDRPTATQPTASLPDAWHDLVEYEVACAYQHGLAEGRRAFAAEMLDALRPAYPGRNLREGIGHHLRAVDQLQRRRQADAAANLPRPTDRKGEAA